MLQFIICAELSSSEIFSDVCLGKNSDFVILNHSWNVKAAALHSH